MIRRRPGISVHLIRNCDFAFNGQQESGEKKERDIIIFPRIGKERGGIKKEVTIFPEKDLDPKNHGRDKAMREIELNVFPSAASFGAAL